MKWVFWGSAGLIAYTYFGYPAWLWLRGCWKAQRVQHAAYTPFVSVVMVIRNEAEVLPSKLRNLMELNYPADLLEMIVASDGSTDETNQILSRYSESPQVRVIQSPHSRGKAACLNDAIQLSRGEVVVFTDARQIIELDALRLLLENFADPTVGCASGELMLGDPNLGEASRGMGVYWGFEKKVRELESLSGSVVGATGAFYAARRDLLVPLPPETILDDVYLPMQVVLQKSRVVLDVRARAWDRPNLGGSREFSRKVRTLNGNYQLLQTAPWLLSSANPIRFEFVSHKLLRLVMPFALAAMLGASFVLREPVYRVGLGLQLAFYGLSILTAAHVRTGPLARMADAAFTFVVLNSAALVAFANFVTGRKAVWVR